MKETEIKIKKEKNERMNEWKKKEEIKQKVWKIFKKIKQRRYPERNAVKESFKKAL